MKKTNLYLSARYSRQQELRKYAEILLDAGFDVCARWLTNEDPAKATPKTPTHEERIAWGQVARRDYQDVLACDIMVHFAEPVGSLVPGGGRNVEFGMAIAMRKPLIVVGEYEHVFHYMPTDAFPIKHVASINEVPDAIKFFQLSEDCCNV